MILLLTHSKDFFTIDKVSAALDKRNVSYIRLNTDLFPTQIKITQSIDKQRFAAILNSEYGTFSTTDIQAVWLRRIWNPTIGTDIDAAFRPACLRESKRVMQLFLNCLDHAFWLDSEENINRASDKLYQLKVAKSLGISIPKTMITNDHKALLQFYKALDGRVITKMLTTLSYGMTASSFFMYTSKVKEEHLQNAELLRYCPMVFQEMIEKAYELRIIYVDGQFFTGKINATKTAKGKVDWRRSHVHNVQWETYQLPLQIQGKLTQFMHKIKLTYGAIDIIKTAEGDYVFLEVNPNGEWGMIEKELGEPIAATIAETLCKYQTTPIII